MNTLLKSGVAGLLRPGPGGFTASFALTQAADPVAGAPTGGQDHPRCGRSANGALHSAIEFGAALSGCFDRKRRPPGH